MRKASTKCLFFCKKKNNKRYVYERLNILDILVLLQMKTLSRFIGHTSITTNEDIK